MKGVFATLFLVSVVSSVVLGSNLPSSADETSEWPSSPLNETEIQTYLEKNRWILDPIEGIWTYSEVQVSRHNGVSNSSEPLTDIYRIAIVGRDLDNDATFDVIILSSQYDAWNVPGRIKGHFTSTGQDGVYAAQWFGGSYQEFRSLFVLDPGRRRLNGAFQLQLEQETVVSDVTLKKTFPSNAARISRLH